MKTRLKALTAKFDALQQREKQMVAAAVLFAVVMGGYTFGVEPAQQRAAALRKQIAKQKADLQTAQAQVVVLRAQMRDPDAPNKQALAETREKLAVADRALHEYDAKLVPPERVPQLLQSVLAHHRGLQLVSLQTLPPAPLLAPKAEEKPPAGTAAAKPAPTPAPAERGANLHKHGLEIRMAGSYLDLLAYVEELERLPQKLLWGRMSLSTAAWPRSELTLTVYTLSLDPTWMIV